MKQQLMLANMPFFVAVVKQGSFSAAANELNVTKSAVSKRINQLEQYLGLRLLQRNSRRVSLTDAGQLYYQTALHVLSYTEDAAESLQLSARKVTGRLRITVPMVFGRRYVAPLIQGFMQQYPELNIELMLDDKMVDLIADGYDLAIRIGHIGESDLVARRLAPCSSLMLASPDYLARCGIPKHPNELSLHNCLTYSLYQGGAEWRLWKKQQVYSIKPRGNLQSNNSEVLRQLAVDGAGVCQLPTFIAADDVIAGRLVPILAEYKLAAHAVYAMFAKREYLPAKVSLFIDYLLKQYAGELAPWDKGLGREILRD